MNKTGKIIGMGLCAGLIASALAASPARAEREGHGGLGYVCRNDDGTVASAKLYEMHQLGVVDVDLRLNATPFEYLVELGMSRLTLARDHALMIRDLFKRTYRELYRTRKEIPAGKGILFDSDAFPKVPTYDKSSPCRLEMIAHTERGVVRLDMELYPHLDALNKAALWLHETVYYIAKRMVMPASAVPVRDLVQQLVRKNPDRARLRDLIATLLPLKAVSGRPWEVQTMSTLVADVFTKKEFSLQVSVMTGSGSFKTRDLPRVDALEMREIKVTDLLTRSVRILRPGDRDYPAVKEWSRGDVVQWKFPNGGDWKHKLIELQLTADRDAYSAWKYTRTSVMGATGGTTYSLGGHTWDMDAARSSGLDRRFRIRIVVL